MVTTTVQDAATAPAPATTTSGTSAEPGPSQPARRRLQPVRIADAADAAAGKSAPGDGGPASKRPRLEEVISFLTEEHSDDAPSEDEPLQEGDLTELELEERIAEAVGLGADEEGLLDEEREAFTDAVERTPGFVVKPDLYIQVRNTLLALWRADVRRHLSLNDARAAIQSSKARHAELAWRFLHTNGYINIGTAAAPVEEQHPETVVVVGAGLAGLAAAQQLIQFGYRVVVVEARDRPGGRVHTHKLQGRGGSEDADVCGAADLGGSIVTGCDGNPLAVLAAQHGIPLHVIRADAVDVPAYWAQDGSRVDEAMDEQVTQHYNKLLQRCDTLCSAMGPAAREFLSVGAALEAMAAEHEQQQQQQQLMQAAVQGQQQQEQRAGARRGRRTVAQEQQQKAAAAASAAAAAAAAAEDEEEQDEPAAAAEEGAGSPPHAPTASPDASPSPPQQRHHRHQRQPAPDVGRGRAQHEALLQWHIANLEFANAARARDLSLAHWAQDDHWELLGDHVLPQGGNGRLVQALCRGVPILYNTPIKQIRYHAAAGAAAAAHSSAPQGAGAPAGGVTLVTEEGVELMAHAAVVTLPLGVLKAGDVAFEPPLPDAKLQAVKRLGYGVLNKVALLFARPFWDTDVDMFAHVVADPRRRGAYYLFYTAAHTGGGAVLVALVAGSAALDVEGYSDARVRSEVMAVLRSIYQRPHLGLEVPEPLEVRVTRWGADRYSRGSYSSMAVGCRGACEYQHMAQPVAGRLFFAGEATIHRYPATMHGAYLSGLREAGRVHMLFSRARRAAQDQQQQQQQRKDRRAADGDEPIPAQHLQQPATSGAASPDAAAAASPQGANGAAGMPPPSAGVLESFDRVRALDAGLRQLFASCEPDLEFGAFRVLLPPPAAAVTRGSPPEPADGGGPAWRTLALVQIDAGQCLLQPLPPAGAAAVAAASVPLPAQPPAGSAAAAPAGSDGAVALGPLHVAMPSVLVEELMALPGGDRARVAALTQRYGVKLAGRTSADVLRDLEPLLRLMQQHRLAGEEQ